MFFKYFSWLVIWLPLSLFGQQLGVTSVSPAQNSNIVSSNTEIRIDFNVPIDTTGISQQFVINGDMKILYSSTVLVAPSLQSVVLYPTQPFLVGERIEVIIRQSLQGNNGENFNGYNWSFTIQPTLPTPPYFSAPVIYSQFISFDLITCDVNNDDYIDIILNSGQILTNDGMGNFSLYQDLPSAPAIWMTDVDLDSAKDLILDPYVFEQAPNGYFYYDSTLAPVYGDMNRDGFQDYVFAQQLITSDSIHYVGIRYNDGTGSLSSETDTLFTDTNIIDLTIGDFNNDGIIDITYYTQTFAIPGGVGGRNSLGVAYLNSNADTLYRNIYNREDFPYGMLGMPFLIRSVDFNNDGFLDIALFSNAADYVIMNDANGGFLVNNAQLIGTGDIDKWITTGDITGDGWIDMVYDLDHGIGEHSFTFYIENDSGQFGSRVTIFEKLGRVSSSAIADFNNDGAQDIASAWHDGLYIHFNQETQAIETNLNQIPHQFTLYQNYPNPFNNKTIARFYLPKSRFLESIIYDITGKEVRHFNRKRYAAGEGTLTWDGKNNFGKEVSSGIYIWEFKSQGIEKHIKIILTR